METSSWSQELPWVLIGIRSAPRDADGVSAAERDFGTPICLPGDFLDTPVPPADSFMNKLKTLVENTAPAPALPKRAVKVSIPKEIISTEFVFVRRMAHASPFSPLYLGPYKVVNRDTNYFCIQIGNRQELINVSRLKPFYSECVQPAVPPRRGRPPAARPGADLPATRSSFPSACTAPRPTT